MNGQLKSRPLIIAWIAALLLAGSALLSEEPPASTETRSPQPPPAPRATAHSENFPEIVMDLPAGSLDSSAKPDLIRYAVREDDGSKQGATARLHFVRLPEESPAQNRTRTGPLYAVVIDATKSIPSRDFVRSVRSAAGLVDDLPRGSRLGIFRINGKPTLLQDFTADSDALGDGLKRIKRDGKVTRVYDSLFYALRETASVAKKLGVPVGGLVLFTDGRDEGSYLTEEDCLEIAAKGKDLEIPIFVVLNGAAKNERLFKRMALRSGGELFRGKVEFHQLVRSSGRDEDAKPLQPERAESRPGPALSYTSTMPFWKAWPGSTVHVQAFYDDHQIAEATYQVPGLGAYVGAHPLLFSVLFLVLMGLLGLFLWMLLRFARQKPGTKAVEPASAASEQKLNIPGAYSEIFVDAREAKNNVPVETGKRIESEVEQPGMREEAILTDPKRRKDYETDAVTLNMKEKAYVVLQMALKEAPPYSMGTLVKKERDMNRLDRRFDLFLEETYIGNSSGATLPVKDVALGAIHAKIKKFEKKFILFDLGGAAGIFLNGKKVLRPMALRTGDEIRMGHTMFLFQGEK